MGYKGMNCKNRFILWKPNKSVFTYSIRDMNIVRRYASKIYEEAINILDAKSKRLLFKECLNVAAIKADLAIIKMINKGK